MATLKESYTQSLPGYHLPVLKGYTGLQKPDSRAEQDTWQIPYTVAESVQQPLQHLEADPNGIQPKEPGAKLDKGKVDVLRGCLQYFPAALEAVAHVSELGARKYSWMGWRTVPDGIRRYGAALARHLFYDDFATDNGPGGLGDEVLHASQVAWNALARLELILEEKRKRDATKNPNP